MTISGAKTGPTLVLDATVAGGTSVASSAWNASDVDRGCANIIITDGTGATAAGTLKLQASLDGVTGWYDTSTNHAVSIASNDWKNTNGFSAGFGFADVNAPHVRLYLAAGAGMAGDIQCSLWGKPEKSC
jgi:hypothetical protein